MTVKEVTVGIDIGGTNTVFGFIDERGDEIGGGHFPTYADEPPEQLIRRLADAIKSGFMSLEDDQCQLTGIGIGAPNANFHTGTVEHPPNFDWEVVNVVDLMKRHFDLPVVITNDANAAALGEMLYGGAGGMKDFIQITLGTGLGSGLVVDGRIVFGHDGFAGEMGHLTVDPKSDRRCGCGKYGCLETWASATGVARTARQLLEERSDDSLMRLTPRNELTSKGVFLAAEKGDALAREVFEITGSVLGMKLADAVMMLSPEAIFFFGGLARAGSLLLDPARRSMEANLLPIFRGKVRLEVSRLQDRNVAVLGAAALIQSTLRGNA
jgi:glucokinase